MHNNWQKQETEKVRQEIEQKILQRTQREWYDGIIVECEEASRSGRLGDMYIALGKLSRRGWKAPPEVNTRLEQLRDYFQ